MVELAPPIYPDLRMEPLADFRWPGGARCGVTFAWHVDGEAGPMASDRRAVNHVAAISEAAYGVTTAMPRILDLHRALEVPGTFFVPAHVAERHPAMIEAILKDGHEIAHHGYMHENLAGMAADDQRAVFEHASEILARLTGAPPEGWSAPAWGVSVETLEIMAAMGFTYDASLMEYDVPHRVWTRNGPLVELPISMVLDDWALFGSSIYWGGDVALVPAATAETIWREEFDGMFRYGGLFQTTFHPNLMGRPGRLLMLERLLSHMRSQDGVWWGTCSAAARHVLALEATP
jgi:peptidoglycan/xylan/chitin deacetylase (PgdA/CDA1 family)